MLTATIRADAATQVESEIVHLRALAQKAGMPDADRELMVKHVDAVIRDLVSRARDSAAVGVLMQITKEVTGNSYKITIEMQNASKGHGQSGLIAKMFKR